MQATIWSRRRQPRQVLEEAKEVAKQDEGAAVAGGQQCTDKQGDNNANDTNRQKSRKIRKKNGGERKKKCGEWHKTKGKQLPAPATTAMAKMRGKCVNDTEQFTIIAGRVAGRHRRHNLVSRCLKVHLNLSSRRGNRGPWEPSDQIGTKWNT